MRSKRIIVSSVLSLSAFAGEPLVGAGVGSTDLFISEGKKLFNKKQYPKAAEQFQKAVRANPGLLPPYADLARALVSSKQLQKGCFAYRVYLKAAGVGPDRAKIEAEAASCEAKLKAQKVPKGQPPPEDLTQKYVEMKAQFYAGLDKGDLLGAQGALESLKTLVKEGFIGPELGDMAQKLGVACLAAGDEIYKKAITSSEKVGSDVLRTGKPLYQAAADVGSTPGLGNAAFLDGVALLQDKEFKKAEGAFGDAVKADPNNREYLYHRSLATLLGGDRAGALKVLDEKLKDDPRTQVIRVAQTLGTSTEAGAAELEKLLFLRRGPADK